MQEITEEQKNEIKKKINLAQELVEGVDEPARSIALQYLIPKVMEGQLAVGGKVPSKPSLSVMEINEFLAPLAEEGQTDQILGIVYYFHHYYNESVTTNDFLESFKKSRMSPPANPSVPIGSCVKKGFLVATEKDERKSWRITPRGEKYVEEQLLTKEE